jgi:hypothetical protein
MLLRIAKYGLPAFDSYYVQPGEFYVSTLKPEC